MEIHISIKGKTYDLSPFEDCAGRLWTLDTGTERIASSSFFWRKSMEIDKEILYSVTVEDNIYAIEPPKFETYEEWSDWLDDLDSSWRLYKSNS